MTLIDLTFLIIQLNSLVDYDLHKEVSLDEAKQHIEKGDVFEWLGKKFDDHIDLSIYRNRASGQEITNELKDMLDGYSGNERRKWGVEHNGICLLIAWINELIQQRAWTDARQAI